MAPNTTGASTPERYMRMTSGCTTTLAQAILTHVSPPISSTPTPHVLDLGCGPAVLTAVLKAAHPTLRITAADISPDMLAYVESQRAANGWTAVTTAQVDIRSMPSLPDGAFSHVLSSLTLPVPGDGADGGAGKMLAEVSRVLRPGGVVALTTWADRAWTKLFWEAARRVRPNDPPPAPRPMEIRAEFQTGKWLFGELEKVFGRDVEVRCVTTAVAAPSLDELVDNMMLASGVMFPGYSEAELSMARDAVKELFKESKTFEDWGDGGVRIGMRAWLGMAWKRGETGDVC